jgi:hypothetical protein
MSFLSSSAVGKPYGLLAPAPKIKTVLSVIIIKALRN